jgi:hypothetical protein
VASTPAHSSATGGSDSGHCKEIFDLEAEKDDEPDFINFNYFCNCPTDIDLRDYLKDEGFKEIEDPNYTDGFIEIFRSWNREPRKSPLKCF